MGNAPISARECGTLRYLVSAPSARERGAGGGAPPPLLCFLHGYDEAAPLAIEQALTRHGPLSRAASPVARGQFVIVAPQLPRPGDIWHRYAAAVREIVATVARDTRTDPARAYLTGFSFGGNGVFDLAAVAAPGCWAALWTVDPTRVPREDPGLPVWVSVGDAARAHVRGFVRALGLRSAAVDSGATLAGGRYYLDEGLDHVGSAASAYADRRIYDWMLGQRAGWRKGGRAER